MHTIRYYYVTILRLGGGYVCPTWGQATDHTVYKGHIFCSGFPTTSTSTATTTTATSTTGTELADLRSRMSGVEKMIEDEMKAGIAKLTADQNAKLADQNAQLAAQRTQAAAQTLEIAALREENSVLVTRLAAVEGRVFPEDDDAGVITATTTTPRFDGSNRAACKGNGSGDGCAPEVASTQDGGMELNACCGNVVRRYPLFEDGVGGGMIAPHSRARLSIWY